MNDLSLLLMLVYLLLDLIILSTILLEDKKLENCIFSPDKYAFLIPIFY